MDSPADLINIITYFFLPLKVDLRDNVFTSEVKVSVVSFQKTPTGMCPYFVVASIPHTINENTYWGSAIINACVAATEHASNAVTLNTSTDGVQHKKMELYTVC